MEYCLIEDFTTDFPLPKNCSYVALTQNAFYELEKAEIEFITLEEFYTSGELRGDTDAFLDSQLQWFQDFDEFIRDIYPEAARMKLSMASIYFYWIKYAVDNIILTARVLKKFINATNPDKIWFLSVDPPPDEIEHILSFRNLESTYSRLIEPVCTQKAIEFERLTLIFKEINQKEDRAVSNEPRIPILQDGGIKIWLKSIFPKQLGIKIKKIIRRYQNLKFLSVPGIHRRQIKGRIFLLSITDFIYKFCKEATPHNFQFFLYENREFYEASSLTGRKNIRITNKEEANIRIGLDWESILQKLIHSKIMSWIDTQAGMDISDALVSRFELFLKKICPEVLSKIPEFVEFYNDYNIDYVVTYSIWSIDEHAAIAAARMSRKTKSVSFAHGVDAFEAKSRFFKSSRFVDFYFLSTSSEAESEQEIAKKYGYEYPLIYPSPYFQRRYSDSLRKRKGSAKLNNINHTPLIIFVPVMCVPWPNRPVELTQPFPMEYIRWHKALADYLATRTEFQFVWKGLFQPNQKFDIMAEILKDKKYNNISFHSDKLTKWLPLASRVICDTPSTAFFEAIYSGLPTMSLYRPQDQRLRKNAYKGFGLSLRSYSSIEEGLARVEEFLNSAPNEYIVSIPEVKTSAPEILKSHLAGR